VPLTDAELAFMIKNLRRVIRYDMIHVAYWKDKLVGYIVNIPDANWALKRTRGKWDWLRMLQMPFLLKRCPRTRVIALGVDKDYRTKGIAMLLIARLVEKYLEFDEWEFSWVDSENQKSIRAIARALPLEKTRTYQLFEKPLSVS
jgi:GNAT superfamily N-acetyltransferase